MQGSKFRLFLWGFSSSIEGFKGESDIRVSLSQVTPTLKGTTWVSPSSFRTWQMRVDYHVKLTHLTLLWQSEWLEEAEDPCFPASLKLSMCGGLGDCSWSKSTVCTHTRTQGWIPRTHVLLLLLLLLFVFLFKKDLAWIWMDVPVTPAFGG